MTLTLASAAASPAAGADELGLSLDGTHWTPSITTPLFASSFRWVPGDSQTVTVYVRNQGGTSGDLTIDISSSADDELLDSGDLHVTARGGGGAWSAVQKPGGYRLLSTPDIADGAVVPVDVSVAFDPASTNMTQIQSSSFTLIVTLTQSQLNPDPAGDTDAALPATGGPAIWIPWVAAMFVVVGLAVSVRVRDRREVAADV